MCSFFVFQSDSGGAFKGFKGLVAPSGGGGFSGFGNGAGGKPLEGLSNGSSGTPPSSGARAASETQAASGEWVPLPLVTSAYRPSEK